MSVSTRPARAIDGPAGGGWRRGRTILGAGAFASWLPVAALVAWDRAPDAALWQAIAAAEAARAADSASLAILFDAAASPSSVIQQVAVRALGRLERPSLLPRIVPFLVAPEPIVRAEAANAVAQALQGSQDVNALPGAAQALRGRMKDETDGAVRSVLYEALARLPYQSAGDVRDVEQLLVAASREAADAAPPIGVARGFEALYRLHGKKSQPAAPALARVRELARSVETTEGTGAREAHARVRRLAITALQWADASDLATLRAGLVDADVQVRKIATSFVDSRGRPRYSDAKAEELRPFIAEAIAARDASPLVRYEAVQAYGQFGRDRGCLPLVEAARDPSTLVAQAAIDALGRGCPPFEADTVAQALQQIAETLAPGGGSAAALPRIEWHRAAHALVSLASTAPARAAALLPKFERHPVWQVRMYAARAAAVLTDADALRRLAGDPIDNVRSAAVGGLSRVTVHADDAIFLASLGRSDHQVVQLAARALQGSPDKAAAIKPLLAALERFSAQKKDNTRDVRVALLQRMQELGTAELAQELKPYLRDFDPRVASLTADTLTKWTGTPHTAVPNRPKTTPPNVAETMALEASRVRVRMRAIGTFELRLYPFDAPATVERFVRLARAGYYDGLTFHRVVPNWVIQGGSPGASEVTGDSPFMIDEVGMRSHTRGTLGISTRGHDTGDAQFFVNLGDNPSLDHTFGVWAEVVDGMNVVDAVLEGSVIETIDIGPGSR